jgi:hypothetical protein
VSALKVELAYLKNFALRHVGGVLTKMICEGRLAVRKRRDKAAKTGGAGRD